MTVTSATPTSFTSLRAAHEHFSKACFNAAWALIEKPDRTPAEDDAMLRLAFTSHWHWTQRSEFDAVKDSIGLWQISRVYAVLKRPEQAREYGQKALEATQRIDQSKGEDRTVYTAFAHEALARAAMVGGMKAAFEQHRAEAQRLCATIADVEDREILQRDIETLAL